MVGVKRRNNDDDEWQDEGDNYFDEEEQPKKPRYAKKRKLQRWNVNQDQYVLLALVEVCAARNIELPWAEVGAICEPALSAESIKQHLVKAYAARQEAGFDCPPKQARPRRPTAKPVEVQPARKRATLLPPESQLRAVQRRRGNSSIEPPETPVRGRKKSGSNGTQSDMLPPPRPATVDSMSGYSVGSAGHGKFLCNEIASFAAITQDNMPQAVDFMGNQYDFTFDNSMYEGSNHKIHQRIINETADRSHSAGLGFSDEQVRDIALGVGYGGGHEQTFQIKQLRYPLQQNIARNAVSHGHSHGRSPDMPIVISSPTFKTEFPVSQGSFNFTPQVAKMQAAPVDGRRLATQSNAARFAAMHDIKPSAASDFHSTAAVPRYSSWQGNTGTAGQQAAQSNAFNNANAMNDTTAFNWSPSDMLNYTTSATQPGNDTIYDGYIPAAEPDIKSEPTSQPHDSVLGKSTPPDSLNASQLVSPVMTIKKPEFGQQVNQALIGTGIDGGITPYDDDGMSQLGQTLAGPDPAFANELQNTLSQQAQEDPLSHQDFSFYDLINFEHQSNYDNSAFNDLLEGV